MFVKKTLIEIILKTKQKIKSNTLIIFIIACTTYIAKQPTNKQTLYLSHLLLLLIIN